LPVLELRGKRGHARQRTSEGTTNTMLSSRTLYGALMGEGVPVRRIGVASPTASLSPTSERGPPTPATPRTPRPTLDVEDEKVVEMNEKEKQEPVKEEEEPVMREKAPLLAENTGFEGIKEIAQIVQEGEF
jgi:hypothetical protein